MTQYTDQSTWQLFKSGDMLGFELLYSQYNQALYAYGMKICGDEEATQDVIHDLFMDLWSRNKQLPDLRHVKFYLFKALKNKLLKRMKMNKNLAIEDISDNKFPLIISPETSIIQNEEEKQLQMKLQKALDNLTEHQREILYLKFNENLNYKDISEITQLNYQSVVNIVHRTMNTLRKHVGLPLTVLLGLLNEVTLQ